MKIKFLTICVFSSLFSIISAHAGQVITDGSMGTATNLTGPNYTISQDLGATVGNNLFHSFGTFNLSPGDVATFTGANTIQNVISRVTDGNPSSIDGTIESQVGNANFFFINPAGVVFGEHAAVNVLADFHVSTAQELRFADGSAYNLVTPKGNLTAAPPEAFGFLGRTGDIRIENGNLIFQEGTNVTFAGGAVTASNSNITVPRGSLRVYGNGDAISNVPINGGLLVGNGAITMNGGKWDVSENGGGDIWISGGEINIINKAVILNANTGDKNSTEGIHVDANTLLIDDGVIETDAIFKGQTGDIIIRVSCDIKILNGGVIGSVAIAQGNAGNIMITAKNLVIDGRQSKYASITSQTGTTNSPYTTGNAGNITININNGIQLLNGGRISSRTVSQGNAGNVTVTANTLTIGSNNSYLSGIFSDARGKEIVGGVYFVGNAGNIVVDVKGAMQILPGGTVSTSMSGNSNISSLPISHAGSVTVNANSLIIDGGLSPDEFPLEGWVVTNTGITSQVDSSGSIPYGTAGNIVININGGMQIINGGIVSSENMGVGNAGSININVGHRLDITNTAISTSSTSGNGGSITINASALVLNNGIIHTSAVSNIYGHSPGNGGDITISGGYLVMNTGFIEANTVQGAEGGDIFINIDRLLPNGGVVNVGGQTGGGIIFNYGKNVIQAAAPGGENGSIKFKNPNDDTASSIGANSNRLEPIKLAKHPCEGTKGRFNFRRRGDVGLPNSGEDVIQSKQPVKINNEAASLSHKLHQQTVCAAR